MDERNRKLERAAAGGDQESVDRHRRSMARTNGRRTIFTDFLGERAAVWTGPNFCEVGIISEVYIDEIGRGIAIMKNGRRLQDETESGPSWLGGFCKSSHIPSTTVTYICLAEDREGWAGHL